MVVQVVVVGPFEEEVDGTSIASDVVKAKGKDPATPGSLKSVNTRENRTLPQYWVKKTKQHTHTHLAGLLF